MSNEVRATSFRLVADDIERFKELANEMGLNQAEMFQNILNSFQMAKAKGMIADRAKEIEVFQDTINNLMGMFINSLSINQTSEERIRETLSLELNTKDRTIESLQEEKAKFQEVYKSNNEKLEQIEKNNVELMERVEKSNKDIEQKDSILSNQQEQINTLSDIVVEYKEYKNENAKLKKAMNELNEKMTAMVNSNTDLQVKLTNTETMKTFYKDEIIQLKDEILVLHKDAKELKVAHKEELTTVAEQSENQLNSLENKYKDEIESINESHKVDIEKLEKEYDRSLELEKLKIQFELDKSNDKLGNITTKYNKLENMYDELKRKYNEKENK